MSQVAMNIEIDEMEKELVQLLLERSECEQKIRQSSKNIKKLDRIFRNAELEQHEAESIIEAAKAKMESYESRISSIQRRSTKLKSVLKSKFSFVSSEIIHRLFRLYNCFLHFQEKAVTQQIKKNLQRTSEQVNVIHTLSATSVKN
jgi:chromosome segregation ATPase